LPEYQIHVENRIPLASFIALSTIGETQTVILTLQEDLSSKLPTGTVFTAEDSTRFITGIWSRIPHGAYFGAAQ
jgi:hypothetical protein